MVPVEARFRGLGLRGAVSGPGTSWGSARRLTLYVNGRWVHDRLLFRAVMEAYRTYLLKGRYPAAALFLDVDATVVDVNVHPQKLEVRFSDPDVLMGFVVEAIREALRTGAGPLGRWGLISGTRDAGGRPTRPMPYFAPSAADSSSPPPNPSQATFAAVTAVEESVAEDPEIPGYRPAAAEAVAVGAQLDAAPEQQRLFVSSAPARDLEVVGQVFAGYILCEREDEVLLIDQHAAHERVLFERLMCGLAERRLERQPLLVPLTAHVGAEGVDAVARFASQLAELGWELEPFGEEDVIVRAVPAIAAGTDLAALVERLVSDLVRTDAATAASRLVEQVFATVACHAAVRVGKRLDAQGARALLGEIASVDFASSCPHGRPVARSIDRGRIERMFGR
jgi:DNA mismatch repair protein MutL